MRGGSWDEKGLTGGLVVLGAIPPAPIRPQPTLPSPLRSYSISGRVASATTPVRSTNFRDPSSNLPPIPHLDGTTPHSFALSKSLNSSKLRERIDSSVSLPPGWEVRRNEKGQVYFLDHNTRSTHWSLPSNEASKENDSMTVRHKSLNPFELIRNGDVNFCQVGGESGATSIIKPEDDLSLLRTQ
eukprot:TRINITY_DN1106_c0_g2_i2.p1 TRINITY_DN1106_c0_g2~~TRINITY_DN1106_c0_g2_i2.p1  ORF type:complete len:185 (+),score=19.47 TRINITY_DN1106_c0_g2_i2:222-776(+)